MSASVVGLNSAPKSVCYEKLGTEGTCCSPRPRLDLYATWVSMGIENDHLVIHFVFKCSKLTIPKKKSETTFLKPSAGSFEERSQCFIVSITAIIKHSRIELVV